LLMKNAHMLPPLTTQGNQVIEGVMDGALKFKRFVLTKMLLLNFVWSLINSH